MQYKISCVKWKKNKLQREKQDTDKIIKTDVYVFVKKGQIKQITFANVR